MQMHEVRPIATEVAWSVCLCPMPFGMWTRVGARNHVLSRGLNPRRVRGNLVREGVPAHFLKYREYPA